MFAKNAALCVVLSATLIAAAVSATAGPAAPSSRPAEAAPTAEQLIARSIKAAHAEHEESTYAMKLIGSEGEEGVRRMKVWFASKGEEEFKLLVKFMEPATISRTGFLSIIKKGVAPEQWLYLPSVKKARRISGGSSSESFMGSDFSMGDISVDTKGDWKFKITESAKCGDADCWVLVGEPTPESAKDSNYTKQVMNIRKDNSLNVKTEFYNQAKQLEKVMTLEGLKNEGDKLVPSSVRMKNVLTSHMTVIEYEKRDLSKSPADHVFTKSFLEK